MNNLFLINSFLPHSLPNTTSTSVKKENMVCPCWQLPCHNTSSSSGVLLGLTAVKSNVPTRHIALYSKNSLAIGHYDLFKTLKTSGEIRAIYPYISAGITIISYYNLQDAQIGLQIIQKKYDIFEACYAKPCSINKKPNERVFVIISCNNSLMNLKYFDYMRWLTRPGTIYSISEAHITPNCVIINLEYHDERASAKLLQQLNYVTIEGVQFNIYIGTNDEHVCDCNTRLMNALESPSVAPMPTPSPLSTPSPTPLHTPQPTPTSSKTLSGESDEDKNQVCSTPPSPLLDQCPKKHDAEKVENDTIRTDETDSSLSLLSSSKNNSDTTITKEPQPCQKRDNDIDVDKILKGLDKRTTFMIRNIPNKYTQKMLIDCINSTHANSYDFIYLRIDFQNKCNVGYAFINFIDAKHAVSFANERGGKKWKLFNSDKKCSLSYANIQGKEALVRKFKNSHVMNEEAAYRPKIFYSTGPNQGKEQPFPKSFLPKQDDKKSNRIYRRRSIRR